MIKKINLMFIKNHEHINLEEVKLTFQKTLEDIPCEKFIAVGHLIEYMFSQNVNDSELSIRYLIYLFENGIIELDDLKHGIVLGLVNFQDNIIDYPKSKDYLQKLLDIIKSKNIIDEKIFCCHGGLSPDLQSMEQIRRIMRPTDVPDTGLLCDLLWSDPDKEIQGIHYEII